MDDRERLLGRWRNTAGEKSRGIVEVEVTACETGVRVVARAIDGRWPGVECRVYVCGEEDHQPGAAALGVVEFDDASVELQLRVNKGILCVMSWTTYRAPGRNPWVQRELFAREVQP